MEKTNDDGDDDDDYHYSHHLCPLLTLITEHFPYAVVKHLECTILI